MNIETEMMGDEGGNLLYEQPSLKKYGTMKKFTLGASGSKADNNGPGNQSNDPNNVTDPNEGNQSRNTGSGDKPLELDTSSDMRPDDV